MQQKKILSIGLFVLFAAMLASAIIFVCRISIDRKINQDEYMRLNEMRSVWLDNYVINSNNACSVAWPYISTKDCLLFDALSTQRDTPTDSTSLWISPYKTEAQVNGNKVKLDNLAIMRDGEIMLPITEVIELLGGSCLYDEGTGELKIYLKSWNGKLIDTGWGPHRLYSGVCKYESGSGEWAVEESYKAGGALSQNCLQEIDGTLYVGASYLPGEISTGWAEIVDGIYYGRKEYPTEKTNEEPAEAPIFIMTVVEEDFGIAGIIVGEPFDLRAIGIQLNRKGLHTYANEDIQVKTKWDCVLEAELVSEIKLLSNKYLTPRGIRIGSFISEVSTAYQCDVCFAHAILIEKSDGAYIEMHVSAMIVEQIRIATHQISPETSEPKTIRLI